jgi:hypothetical protein
MGDFLTLWESMATTASTVKPKIQHFIDFETKFFSQAGFSKIFIPRPFVASASQNTLHGLP